MKRRIKNFAMASSTRIVNGTEAPGCVVKEIEKKLYKTLKDVFGYDSYRSLVQKRAVEAVANSSQDVFVSMPTGAGKSLCYQLPALVSERPGVTIVVSPLIALMTNQIEHMKSIGICTETINSKMTASERERVKADLMNSAPNTKLLYITPELAGTPGFHLLISHLFNNNNVARIVVDEAHCVSEWGHNFRPDYLRLGELREKFMSVPWIALTATASVKVMDDVLSQLKLCQPVAIFKTSCFRPNLFYDVVFKELIDKPYEDLKEFAYSSLGEHWEMTPPSERGCGIVYCRTRDSCEEVALRLTSLGLRTQAYHAGMKPNLRQEVQSNWMLGRTPVIAATVSFGMGIDKPSVRFVAHWCVSQSLAGYYQESGRAGRDGETAHCRIYYSQKDRDAIVFLLKKDESSSLSKSSKIKASASQKSFSAMIKYCEEMSCRHYLLSREFGDDIPDCKKYCDACCSPKTLEHKVSLFRSIKLGSKLEQQKFSFNFRDLYGGGRKGVEEETDAYYTRESDAEREINAGKELTEFISKEFAKRRGGEKSNKSAVIVRNSKVLEPSLKKIAGLSVEAREKYFDKLESELKKNLSACSGSSQCPNLSNQNIKNCAAECELNAFRTKGNVHAYRKDFILLFKSLQEATRQVEIHPILSKYVPKPDQKIKSVPKERLHNLLDMFAKQKVNNEKSKSENFNNSQSCSSSQKTCGSSHHSDTSATDDFKRGSRTLSTDSRHNENRLERHKLSTASDSSDSDCSMNTNSKRKLGKNASRSETSKSIASKPMIKYFFESVTGHATNIPSHMSPEQASFASPKSAVTPVKKETAMSGAIIKRSSSTESQHSPKKQKKAEHAITVKPVVEKKKEPMKTTSQIQNDNLKKAADLVRKHLNPQYKANKISKDLFKIVCRSISHRLVEAGAVNDRAAKLEVEKLFEQYSIIENSSVASSL